MKDKNLIRDIAIVVTVIAIFFAIHRHNNTTRTIRKLEKAANEYKLEAESKQAKLDSISNIIDLYKDSVEVLSKKKTVIYRDYENKISRVKDLTLPDDSITMYISNKIYNR